ncbi:MAG: ATP-binding cassette domain-containing protein, partial [Pseudomonadota bacterium]|nr:ATP-binding cassette domain-containing protein [Pseudomonadota bacterium]
MMLSVSKLEKSFHLYQQNNAHISVLSGASFDVAAGECVALTGPSGCGKSSLMRMIYGNYRAEAGSIMIGDTDLLTATPREVM